jgi:hypothetical protein
MEKKGDSDYVLFRGQPRLDTKRPLLPLISRNTFAAPHDLPQDERLILEEFKAQAVPLLSFTPTSPLE